MEADGQKECKLSFPVFPLGDSGNVCALLYLQSVDAGTGELVNPTPLYQKVACGEYHLYLTQCAYSEQDQVLQIVLEKENKGVEDQKFLYEILERTGRKRVPDRIWIPAYVVIRISEMMKNWKELSMHVDTEGGDRHGEVFMNSKKSRKWRHFRNCQNGNIRCYG